jgi:hypothetical protein
MKKEISRRTSTDGINVRLNPASEHYTGELQMRKSWQRRRVDQQKSPLPFGQLQADSTPSSPYTRTDSLVQKRKSAYALLEKNIDSKKEVMNTLTTIRHRAVLAFLQLQLKLLHDEIVISHEFYFLKQLVT